jgi:putative endonuclease
MPDFAPASPWFCYLLECADGSFYAGITTDLERRVGEHNQGTASKYTRGRLPVRLAYAEPHPDRASATRREQKIKAMPRAAKQTLIVSSGRG